MRLRSYLVVIGALTALFAAHVAVVGGWIKPGVGSASAAVKRLITGAQIKDGSITRKDLTNGLARNGRDGAARTSGTVGPPRR